MAISETALAEFMAGDFGKAVPESLLRHLEEERLRHGGLGINATMIWNQGAKEGESIIRVAVYVELPLKEGEERKITKLEG